MRYVELFNSIGLTIERILSQNIRAWYCDFFELVCSINEKYHYKTEELIATLEAIQSNIVADLRKEKYFDVHNIEQYIKSLFVRSLQNFITGSRDFSAMIDDIIVDGIDKEVGSDGSGKT